MVQAEPMQRSRGVHGHLRSAHFTVEAEKYKNDSLALALFGWTSIQLRSNQSRVFQFQISDVQFTQISILLRAALQT